MKTLSTTLTLVGLVATLAYGAAPAVAHHSFGHYEMGKTSEIEGVVSKWEWSNPHCWLFVDVQKDGKTVTYGFELSSVGELLRGGWKKTSVKVGDKLKVSYNPMRDGTPAGKMTSVRDAVTGTAIGRRGGGGGAPGGGAPGGGAPGGGAGAAAPGR